MSRRSGFSGDEARRVGEEIGIDWAAAPFPHYYTRLERMEAAAKREHEPTG